MRERRDINRRLPPAKDAELKQDAKLTEQTESMARGATNDEPSTFKAGTPVGGGQVSSLTKGGQTVEKKISEGLNGAWLNLERFSESVPRLFQWLVHPMASV